MRYYVQFNHCAGPICVKNKKKQWSKLGLWWRSEVSNFKNEKMGQQSSFQKVWKVLLLNLKSSNTPKTVDFTPPDTKILKKNPGSAILHTFWYCVNYVPPFLSNLKRFRDCRSKCSEGKYTNKQCHVKYLRLNVDVYPILTQTSTTH